MNFEKHMITSLAAMLHKGECLQLAFYGKLKTGSLIRPKEWYCFFGLTGNDLLMINYSPLFRKNGFTVRVPLHIRQVKVKKTLISEKYKLRFRLEDAERPLDKFLIVVKSELFEVPSQKENVELFLSYVEKHM